MPTAVIRSDRTAPSGKGKLWYNKDYLNQNTHVCFDCNSRLILVSKVTEKVNGSMFPQTTSIYRCSNKECQGRKDKETAKRKQMKVDKEVADILRAELKLKEKKLLQKSA